MAEIGLQVRLCLLHDTQGVIGRTTRKKVEEEDKRKGAIQ
jgi:hypothetical protein